MKYTAFIALVSSYWFCRGDSVDLTLDIKVRGSDSKFFVEENEVDGVCSSKYLPVFGHKLTKVTDGDSIIWESNTVDKKCNVAVAYSLSKEHTMVYLTISGVYNVVKDVYFEKSGSEWTPIDKTVYYTRLGLYTPGALHGAKVLDISKANDNLFNVNTSKADGVVTIVYTPKVGVQVGKVTNEHSSIWEDDCKFIQATVYSVCGKPILLHILTETQDEDCDEKYYEFDNQWHQIGKEEYTKAIANVKFYKPPFDISNVDLNKVHVEEYEAFGVQTLVYTPNSDTPVTRIVEGGINIWESKFDDKVDKVWVYSKAGEYLRTQLRIINSKNNHIINQYKKHKNEWFLFTNDEL